MKREMIVAYGQGREIGQNGDMPWSRSLPTDMAHFRAYTLGKSVIMGRTTFDSLPRPLPNRQNIVVTSRPLDADVTVVHSLPEAYEAAEWRPIVIGGGALYLAALPDVETIFVTEVQAEFPDADTFFPALGEEWQEAERVRHTADERNRYDVDFITYARR